MLTDHFWDAPVVNDNKEYRDFYEIQNYEHISLALPLPENVKVGIAHLTCPLIANMDWESHLKVLVAIKDSGFEYLFKRAQDARCGIELNIPIFNYSDRDLPRVLRTYEIAKASGCKFYLGSDAHVPNDLNEARKRFDYIIDLLDLCEEDKYFINKE